jgi:hypothetical protein
MRHGLPLFLRPTGLQSTAWCSKRWSSIWRTCTYHISHLSDHLYNLTIVQLTKKLPAVHGTRTLVMFYHVRKRPLLKSILRKLNAVHNFTTCFFNEHFNTNSSHPIYKVVTQLVYSIPDQTLYAFLMSPMRAACLVRLNLLDLIILIIFYE